ncbi:MAG: hypothetical protein ACK2UK_09940, partial [Candidatus Promineifilaceae bacterium]
MIRSRNSALSDQTEKWLRVILVLVGVFALLGFVQLVSADSPQISGIGYSNSLDEECPADGITAPEGQDLLFAIKMTGDLEG